MSISDFAWAEEFHRRQPTFGLGPVFFIAFEIPLCGGFLLVHVHIHLYIDTFFALVRIISMRQIRLLYLRC